MERNEKGRKRCRKGDEKGMQKEGRNNDRREGRGWIYIGWQSAEGRKMCNYETRKIRGRKKRREDRERGGNKGCGFKR